MQIGVVFPQTELGGDAGAVRAYAQGVASFGYAHILAYDHVVGADPGRPSGLGGPYDVDTTFHEPFVLFGYLAAVSSLELVTGIIILPQRQTALVAKQAAEVDLLTGGRFRLGIGLGWNAVEYETLGRSFSDRGRRSEEQIALLRRLWTERSVTTRSHRAGAGSRPGAAAHPAAHSDLDRRHLRAGPPAGRAPGRRLVSPGGPGPRAGRGPGHRRRGGSPRRSRPQELGMEGRVPWTEPASTRWWITPTAGARREPATCRSTPWAPAWRRWRTM